MIRIPTAVLFAFALVTAPMATQAGDAAALRVLGFSPDGSVFAFEQFTMLYEDDAAFSEYVFIDTRTDRYLPNTPVRVLVRGDEGLDEKKARADAVRRATPLIAQHRVSEAGTHIQGAPSMDLDDIGIYQADPKPLARTLSFALPDGRKTELAIAERALGKAVCKGAGGGRVPCLCCRAR